MFFLIDYFFLQICTSPLMWNIEGDHVLDQSDVKEIELRSKVEGNKIDWSDDFASYIEDNDEDDDDGGDKSAERNRPAIDHTDVETGDETIEDMDEDGDDVVIVISTSAAALFLIAIIVLAVAVVCFKVVRTLILIRKIKYIFFISFDHKVQ